MPVPPGCRRECEQVQLAILERTGGAEQVDPFGLTAGDDQPVGFAQGDIRDLFPGFDGGPRPII